MLGVSGEGGTEVCGDEGIVGKRGRGGGKEWGGGARVRGSVVLL